MEKLTLDELRERANMLPQKPERMESVEEHGKACPNRTLPLF